MTTTVTIETHGWPVEVTTNDDHEINTPDRRQHGYSCTTEFVPTNTKRQFHVSNTRSIAIRELPADATGLSKAEPNF